MIIEIAMGDTSGDGHGQISTVLINTNVNRAELEAAYKAGTAIIGFDFSKEVACDYGDSRLSKKFHAKLKKFNIITDEYDKDEEYLWTDGFFEIWMGIAILGNPSITYDVVQNASIDIGGYGLLGN